jgi:hypothetical protein
VLVLKCDQGFVGFRANSNKLECNKASYDTITVERSENGQVFFKSERKHCVVYFRIVSGFFNDYELL